MAAYDVTLVCSFVLTVEAESEKEASELAQGEMNDNPPEINFDVTDVQLHDEGEKND